MKLRTLKGTFWLSVALMLTVAQCLTPGLSWGRTKVLELSHSLLPPQALSYLRGDINSDDKIGLPEAINALEITAGSKIAPATKTINVPGDIATIQQAVDAASPGDVINVAAGSYTEKITITKDYLTIQGAGSGSTTITGIAGSDTLTIEGAGKIVISGVAIQQGKCGILAGRGAVIDISDAIVQDTTDCSIRIDESSTARLTNVTVRRSAMDGISVFSSSSITFLGTVTSNNNTGSGISIMNGSSAFFSGAMVTANTNGVRGVQTFLNSSIFLMNNSSLLVDNGGRDGLNVSYASSFTMDATCSLTARSSMRRGIQVCCSASLNLAGTTLVQNNAGEGVVITQGATFYVMPGGTVTIQNNVDNGLRISAGTVCLDSTTMLDVSGTTGTGNGISLNASSTLAMGGGLLVQNNSGTQGIGIAVSNGSQLGLNPSSPQTVVIQNNGTGIKLWDGAGVSGGGSITITGNTAKDLGVYFGSRASLPTGSYNTVDCSQSITTMEGSCP